MRSIWLKKLQMRRVGRHIAVACAVCAGVPLAMVAVAFAVGAYLYLTADFRCPEVAPDLSRYEVSAPSDSVRQCGKSALVLNRYGVWEAHIAGSPIERGAEYGVLCKELLRRQEDAFVGQIRTMIPSDAWVRFLHKLIIIFNRNMASHVPEEYREEIYALSQSCTDEYNAFGSPYVRQLNYHAAHDIGHAMQRYMLVGCSAFACRGSQTESGRLMVGRNFDFYVGDDFARNKMVLFVAPESGYKFASVAWPGMMGVVSGMNERGLTVTINAAAGKMPTASATPVSLLARHILQYASNIAEAYAIAQKFDTFVAESLLIGSAQDGRAAIIEKSPAKTALYESDDERIVCTNHYQSAAFADDCYNRENIATTDSPYRYARLGELLDAAVPIDADAAAGILRNRYGLHGADIGLGNEKSINQFLAHHSVVFDPEALRFWVSTSPWQAGEYLCYDLHKAFDASAVVAHSCVSAECNIAADSVALRGDCVRVCRYREQYKTITSAIASGRRVSEEYRREFAANNPAYFQVYNVLGDYARSQGDCGQAVEYWQQALSCEIPRVAEREEISGKIQKYDKR